MAWVLNYEPKKRVGRRSRGFGSHFEDGVRGSCASLRSVLKNGSVAYTLKASCVDLLIRTTTQTKDRQGLTSTLFRKTGAGSIIEDKACQGDQLCCYAQKVAFLLERGGRVRILLGIGGLEVKRAPNCDLL